MEFQAISSLIEPSFWHLLNKVKLNDKMLDETPFSIRVFFQAGRDQNVKSFAFINEESFEEEKPQNPGHFLGVIGSFAASVYLVNTRQSFRELDRNGIMNSLSSKIIDSIRGREWLKNPSLLLESAFTVFGDLKKWQYTYCFAFPNPVVSGLKVIEAKKDLEIDTSSLQCPSWTGILGPDNSILPIEEAKPDSTFVLVDPSTSDKLGWPAKILAIAIANTFQTKEIKILRLNWEPTLFTLEASDELMGDISKTKFTGWILTPKKTAHFVDLSASMDPMQLFTSAASLNLRLMKWRMCPGLDIDKLQKQKVLLVGCGTLGCNVARFLIGWGVRKFVLIDYGKVSFSNPPRQSLFAYEDCLEGGKNKAEAAAAELKRICPDVEAEAISMSIPMPGHPLAPTEYEGVHADVDKLDGLIKSCDCTFLLTDTRESRWLPTLLATASNSLCISIALGFDTFSVVRCGTNHVGCYFCNDVVAPLDTMTDRTLDMQCTVTRPGIAPMASSYGVELWASIMSSAEGKDCQANSDSLLGTVPHQLRGFLHSWQVYPLSGQPFKHCVACSESIINGWKNEGWEFILKALTQGQFLDEVSGLKAMKESMVDDDCEWDD